VRRASAWAVGAALLAGCATPAVNVKVPTMPMEQAYRASVQGGVPLAPPAGARIVETTVRPDRPAPVVAAPDIRLAFFYQWVDADGNLHYPSWVAIPVETFRWVLPELGGAVPLDGSRAQVPPAAPAPARGRNGDGNAR
jgi:hypothetical protein